ncbi:hypothetical protein CGZ93_02175 [Enemella dayhoffiae]|uniref:DUF4129 domain-containing protein n=1 Tax=Enemella dayhoffiae TaxID=2016507 RepID=A0A255HCN7_9ACTN|nr:hypothetical protein [Enemella dayhoffiae]OYO25272.1 hypothetical protein CGZ93_02175 [Enemella dayhoffiae]
MRPGEAEVFAPVAYSPLWLVLGASLLLAVLGWPLLALWLTRPRRVRPAAPTPPPDPAELRRRTLAEISHVHSEHAAGRITAREAQQRLSRVVRRFGGRASGVPADTMTLAELAAVMQRDPRLAELTDYVALLHPPSFAPSESGDVPAACARAEELVARWADPHPAQEGRR